MFQQLITFVLQLRADAAYDSTVLRQRDRAIGQSLSALRGKPIAQLNAWCSTWYTMIHARWRNRWPTPGVLSLIVLLAGLMAWQRHCCTRILL